MDEPTVIEAIQQARQVIRDLGPQPVRIEMTSANFKALRQHLDEQLWEEELRDPNPVPVRLHPPTFAHFGEVPVVINNDLAHPGYQIIYSDGSTKP